MKKERILELLKEARRSATFENAGFYFNDETKNKEVKKVTKLYRETWIIARLDEAICLIEESR